MRKLKILLSIVLISFIGGNIIYANQLENDQKRINDIHHIANLIEHYKEKTGYYPFAKSLPSHDTAFEVQIGLNHIVNSIAYNGFTPKDDRIKEIGFKYFEEELKSVLGDTIDIPFDPQKTALNHLSFYVYHVQDSHYWLACHLKGNHKYAKKLGKNYYKYEVTSYKEHPKSPHFLSLTEGEKQEILKPLPDIPLSLEDEAFLHFQSESYNKAVKLYTKNIKENGPTFYSYLMRGVSYVRLNKYKKALKDYTLAIEYAQTNEQKASAYLNRSYCYAYQEKYTQAIQDVETAIDVDADYLDAYKARADIAHDSGDSDKELDSLNEYLKRNSDDVDYLLRRGHHYLSRNQLKNALSDFEVGSKIGSSEFWVNASIGGYLLKYDRPNDAVNYFKLAIKKKEMTKSELINALKRNSNQSKHLEDVIKQLQAEKK